MRYAIVIEGAEHKEVEAELAEAIRMHLEGLREDGLPIPRPSAIADYVEA